MPPPRTPHEESSDTRIPPPRIRHFERMREIFFVRGKAKDARTAESGKHHAPCESEERCFMQTDSRMKQKMTNEKDPSAPLGMTIRENGRSHIHFIPSRRRLPLRGSLSSAFGAPLLQGAIQHSCKNADPSQGLLPHIVISSGARNLPCTRENGTVGWQKAKAPGRA